MELKPGLVWERVNNGWYFWVNYDNILVKEKNQHFAPFSTMLSTVSKTEIVMSPNLFFHLQMLSNKDGFQNNLTQLFSIMCRCAIWTVCSGRHKAKVTLEGQIFVWTRLQQFWMDFNIDLHNCSPPWVDVPFETFVQVGPRSKSKVKWAQHDIPGQPSTIPCYCYIFPPVLFANALHLNQFKTLLSAFSSCPRMFSNALGL